MKIQNIIFDVDGTLWDTTEVVAGAWNKAVAEAGGTKAVITGEILKNEFGKTMQKIADNLFYDADEEKRKQLMELCIHLEHIALQDTTEDLLYPKVKETLTELAKHCRLFIVSNCQSGYIELFLQKSGLQNFITDFECYGNTGKGKGDNIKQLILRNHLEDVIYVGDTLGDYEATVSAGVPFVFAEYGFGSVAEYYLTIGEMSDLLKYIECNK